MLPDNTLSSQLVYAPFVQAKVAQHSVPLVDYELGGIAIGEPSAGLDVQLWTARYIGNDVVVFDEAGNGTTIITVPGIKRLSLAFDQNMRPLIAYSTLVGSYLYWFDTFLNAFTTTEVPDASFFRAIDTVVFQGGCIDGIELGLIQVGLDDPLFEVVQLLWRRSLCGEPSGGTRRC